MRINWMLSIGVLFTCLSCNVKHSDLQVIYLSYKRSISTLGNNQFVHDGNDIFIDNDSLFFINNGKIFIGSMDMDTFYSFGKTGEGPGEFTFPGNLFVKDESVYVTDMGSLKLMKFRRNGNFVNEWPLEDRHYTVGSFAVVNSYDPSRPNFVFSSPLDGKIKMYQENAFQSSYSDFQCDITSLNFSELYYELLSGKSSFFAVSVSQTHIYSFNDSGKLMGKYDLPDYLFKNRLMYKEREIIRDPSKINSTFKLIVDAYYDNEKLYLLIAENVGDRSEYQCNKVLVVDYSSKATPTSTIIYDLGDIVFQQIAVNDNLLFAYSYSNESLYKYVLDDR